MSNLKLVYKLFIAFVLLSPSAWAQKEHEFRPNFKNFTVDHGLPSNQIYEIMEDHMGFIWIATDRGIVRYDGYDFQVFTVNDGLTTNVVFHLVEDENHVIWAMGYDKKILKIYNENYTAQPKIEEFEHNDLVVEMIQASCRTLSIHPYADGIEVCTSGGLQLYSIVFQNSGEIHTKSENGIHIIHDSLGIRIGEELENRKPHSSSTKIHIDGNSFQTHLDMNALGVSRIIHNDQIPYFSIRNELMSYRDGEICELSKFKNEIIELEATNNNKVMVGLYKGGLYEYDIQTNSVSELLQGCYVSAIFSDKSGYIWVGTLYNGLYRLESNSGKIGFKGIPICRVAGNSRDIILVDDKSNLYYLEKSGIRELDLGEVYVMDHHFEKEENLISITYQSFLNKSNFYTVLKIDSIGNKERFRAPGAYHVRNSQSFYLGSYESIYKLTKNKFEELNSVRDSRSEIVEFLKQTRLGFDNVRINSLSLYQNALFLGTNNGVYKEYSDSLIEFMPDQDFFRKPIRTILNSDSTLYFVSKNHGIGVFKDSELTVLKKEDGLISNSFNGGFNYDNNTVVWSNQGFSIIDNDYSIQNFSVNSGLISNFIHDVYVRNDTAWVGTDKGVNMIPLKREEMEYDTPVFLTSVKSEETDFSGLSNFTIPPRSDYLNLEYLGLSYSHNRDLKYRYQLTNHHSDWVYTDSRQANISGIAAGEHDFLISIENHGKWTDPLKLFSVIKKDHFFKRTWFIVLASWFLLAGIFLIYKIRMNRQKREYDLSMQIVDLERKALQAQMNPHFIFNSLSSLQSLIIDNRKEEAQNYLSSFSKLARLILNHSSLKFVPLKDEIQLLEHYVLLENMRFENVFIYEIRNNVLKDIMIPPMVLQPLLENAILHGLTPLENGGRLKVSFELIDDYIVKCIVEDNGVGFEVDKIKSHVPKGITSVEDRLKLISKKAKIKIEPNAPCGALVTVLLPYTTDEDESADSR